MWQSRVRDWWQGKTVQPLRPMVEWLGRSPLLFALQALPVCMVWGAFDDIGLSSIFFHYVPRVSFIACFMSEMLLGQLCFIGYLLDADESWALAPRPGKRRGVPPTIRWYLFRTGVYPLWLVVLSVPCLVNRHFAFLFGEVAAVGAMLVLARYAERLQHHCQTSWRRQRWLRHFTVTFFRRRPTHVVAMHVLQLGLLALFVSGYLLVAAYVSLTGNQGWVSPAVVICVAIGLCGAVYGGVCFFFPVRHTGAFLFCLVMVVFVGRGCADGSVYDELRLPQAPAYASTSLTPPQEAGLLDDGEALAAWLAAMRASPPQGAGWAGPGMADTPAAPMAGFCGPGPKPPLALVATSGGGIRAAAWTAHVLSRLQGDEGVPGFHRYVRLVTGASGGMVGAGPWVAGLRATGLPEGLSLTSMMQQDSLSAAAIALLLPFGEDRGRTLEYAWREHTDGLLGRPFGALRTGEAEGWLPSLVYSPMLVEDGRRLLVSNLDLSAVASSMASMMVVETTSADAPPTSKARLSLSSVQLFQLFPHRQDVFTVASAARMSASFPYMSPASGLPTEPRVRVVDAGYYDNYGVDLAMMWLHSHREWVSACTSGVVLVQIRDHLGSGGRTRRQGEMGGGGVAGLTSPVEAVLRARESSMSFRNDALLHVLQDELNARSPCFFTTAIFEFGETAPLSWALTEHDKQQLQHAADGVALKTQVDAVREWLTAGPETRQRAQDLGLCPGARVLRP